MPDNNALSAEHLKLQAILENAVDAIITIDEHGIMESANPATETLFQYTADELVGANVTKLMPSPYREEHGGYIDNYIGSGVSKVMGIGREVIGRRRDGTTFPIHLAISEVMFGGRRIFTGIARDISDVKQVERKLETLNNELEERVCQRTDQLREAQAELVAKEKLATLGRVSGGIAHEIRNPLNAVKASAYYLLNAKDASEEKKQAHLARIDRQVMLIDNVITALSDVAKLPEPTVSVVSTVSVDAILADVIRQVAVPVEISVELEVSDNVAPLLADENQIPIVFRNLLRNARDAMPDGGTIVVAAKQVGSKIRISVCDSGVGIASDDLKRIFEPLYSTKARGMGLGLAICQAIVEKNSGRLEVESELGKGSRFTVELSAGTNQ